MLNISLLYKMTRESILTKPFFGCLVLAQTLSLFGGTLTYRPDWDGGSGTWTDATRYYDNRAPVPAEKEIIYFNPNAAISAEPQPIDIVLTDDDWQTFTQLGISRLQGATRSVRIEFNFENDVSWDGQIYGLATVVKNGTGAFRMTRDSLGTVALSYGGRLIVSNGTFKAGAQYQNLTDGAIPTLEVESPGVFEPPSSSTLWLKGLSGNGDLTHSQSSKRSIFFFDSGETFVFSGRFLAVFDLSAGTDNALLETRPKCHQYFTGTENAQDMTIRLYTGTFGAAKFGVADEASSLGGGTGDGNRRLHIFDAGYRHAEHTVLNLGTAAQTTDRIIRIMNGFGTNGVILTLDGGDFGALTWTGAFQNAPAYNGDYPAPLNYWKDHVTPVYLTGRNAGGACVFSGAVTEYVPTNHLFFTKRGSGTWRFAHNASRGFKTPVAVERGTLEYDSIAEAGVNCSLGLATVLSTNWTGFASAYIPYAILLGDGNDATTEDLATFRYTGTAAVSCSTRPIGIFGAGRIDDSNADATVLLSGVSAATPAATLVLDGTRTDSEIDNVTNGVGVLSVEKRGAGTWTMDGDIAYTGATTVKAGTLALRIAPPNYTWFKLTFKNVYGKTGGQEAPAYNYHLRRIAFFSETGTDQALNIAYNSSANGKISSLQPGQCAFGNSDTVGATLGALFTTNGTELSVSRSSTPRISLEDANSWVTVVVRLPSDAAPVTKYDFAPGWYTHNNVPFNRTPTDWKLEGSADGVTWDVLDEQTNQTQCYYSGGLGNVYWVSDASLFSATPVPTAYPVDSHGEQPYEKPTSLTDVSVAHGATLTADAPLLSAKLSCDLSAGAGMIDGLKFAATGVLDVTGDVPRGRPFTLAYDLTGCEDTANLANWQVSFNGRLKPGYTLVVHADGLEIYPSGALIIVR